MPGGRAVVFGTKDVRFADPIAHLYLYTLDDNRLTVLADGQICSNGKVFAADDGGLILYDIDTPRKVVARYRLDVAARTLTDGGGGGRPARRRRASRTGWSTAATGR